MQTDEDWEVSQLYSLKSDVDDIRDYLNVTEKHFADRLKDCVQWIRAETRPRPDRRDQEALDKRMRELNQLHCMFPTMLCNSALMGIWTYGESFVLRLLRTELERKERNLGNHDEQSIQTKIGAMNALRYPMRYLKDNRFVHLSWPEWPTLMEIYEVRNVLAHYDGHMYEHHKNVLQYVEGRESRNLKSLLVSNGNYLMVFPPYCYEALDIWRPFLEKSICQVTRHTPEALEILASKKIEYGLPTDDEEPLPPPTA